MKILGYHISDNVIVNSDGELRDKSPYIHFLVCKKPMTIRVFYDLGDAVSNMAGLLSWSKQQVQELASTTKLYVSPHHFRYIPCKLFSIKKARAFAYYGDVNRYINSENNSNILECARIASEAGKEVYRTLQELGIKPINILNSYKQFDSQILKHSEKPICEQVEILKSKSECSSGIAKKVLNEIIEGIESNYSVAISYP